MLSTEKKPSFFLLTIKVHNDGKFEFINKVKISDNANKLTQNDIDFASTLAFKNINNDNIDEKCMNKSQLIHYKEVLEVANKFGWTVISKKYERNTTKMFFRCPHGHIRQIEPVRFKAKQQCAACSKNCPIIAELNFRLRIKNLGAKVIGSYINIETKVECICINKHKCFADPKHVNSGRGICAKCSNNCPIESKENFYKNIEFLEGKVIGEYIGSNSKVLCVCKNGHICTPTPTSIQQGRTMCLKCVDNCPIQAGEQFCDKIKGLGGTVIGKYINRKIAVECICLKGHFCFTKPKDLHKTGWMCYECDGTPTMISERRFRNFIESNGGKVIGEYLGYLLEIECLCSEGHRCYPRPYYVRDTGRFCTVCNDTNGSFGEKLVAEVLSSMNIEFKTQISHPFVYRLRFDFYFQLNGKDYYIEYDGLQHFKEVAFFHKTTDSFEKRRQRDLMKNYIVNLDSKSILIRISYKWYEKCNIASRGEIIENLSKYIDSCTKSSERTHVDNDRLYQWLKTPLNNETIEKYYLKPSNSEIYYRDFDVDEFNDDDD